MEIEMKEISHISVETCAGQRNDVHDMESRLRYDPRTVFTDSFHITDKPKQVEFSFVVSTEFYEKITRREKEAVDELINAIIRRRL